MSGVFSAPSPFNEPVHPYLPGSRETEAIQAELARTMSERHEIPLTIGGKKVRTGAFDPIVSPHARHTPIGTAHRGQTEHVVAAIDAARTAKKDWASARWEDRAAVLLKAADLLTGRWRDRANASTMAGQSKTIHQSEIDAVCELADFFRFNVRFYRELMEDQPVSPHGVWNRSEIRPLDGFVFAVTPFNFTSIALNLPTAPALLGNTVVWKPSLTQLHSAGLMMELLEEAGLPPGVINLVHGDPGEIGRVALDSPELAGLHFTGSTPTFNLLWRHIGENIGKYRQYPRIVGETGGKDFVFGHPSADVDALVVALLRGAFEYQGQKCSAASRAYLPKSLWGRVREKLVSELEQLKVGPVSDFSNFMGAVIDARAFSKIRSYQELAKSSSETQVLFGGHGDDRDGWFIEPTLVQSANPRHRLMTEEIFGPVLTVHVYDDAAIEETLTVCDESSSYALTGAIFARDRLVISKLTERLRFSAGNFYINDKPTGAVVGQQPFGGSRASGTNDKAGSAANLLRWGSVRAIKETSVPPISWKYPFMG